MPLPRKAWIKSLAGQFAKWKELMPRNREKGGSEGTLPCHLLPPTLVVTVSLASSDSLSETGQASSSVASVSFPVSAIVAPI